LPNEQNQLASGYLRVTAHTVKTGGNFMPASAPLASFALALLVGGPSFAHQRGDGST
jgi:hypothetical protein